MIRRPPRSTQSRSSAASDVYKRQVTGHDLPHSLRQLLWYLRRHHLAPLLFGAQGFRVWRIGHLSLMFKTFFCYMKRHGAGQNFLAILASNNPSNSKATAIAHPLDLVINRHMPIDYEVQRVRDGRSFAVRRVIARQDGKEILTGSMSFHVAEEGFEHQAEMPDSPDPETLRSEQEWGKMMASQE